MRKPRPKTFSEDFRREAVRLASDPNRSVVTLSKDLGVSVETLRNWLRTVPLEEPTSAALHEQRLPTLRVKEVQSLRIEHQLHLTPRRG